MTFHGVPKPAWRAFALLHAHAGARRLSTRVFQPRRTDGNASLISAFATQNTTTGPPSVFLSFWENGGPDFYRDNRSVTVKLGGGNGGAPLFSVATEYRIDESHANPLAQWIAMGSPDKLTQAQVKQLVSASVVQPTTLDVINGAVTVEMVPNSAVCIVFGKS